MATQLQPAPSAAGELPDAEHGRPPAERAVPILFVSSHALRGGAELHLLSLLDRLGPPWIRHVVTLAHGPLADMLRERGHPLTVIETSASKRDMLRSARRLRRLLLRERPALLHADGIKAALIAAMATAGTRIPLLWNKVDFSYDGVLAWAIAARCRRVVGISGAVTETFRPLLARRTRVVFCGIPDYEVDRAESRALVESVLGERSGRPVVLHLGRLLPRKGALQLLDAAPRVLARRPDARFLLLPAAPANETERRFETLLRERAAELGIEGAVTLAPGHAEPVRVLAGCDLLAVPSIPDEISGWREGFGLVAAEAMAVGTPVVAHADGALPEVIGDCGLVVPTGDPAALAAAISRLLDDGALRARLVDAGRRRVERYRLRHTAEAMKRCYREVAGLA